VKSLAFMIIGVQKGGTTALSHFLAQHPDIGMATTKEVHLFDAPDFDPAWSVAEINERYQPYFLGMEQRPILGEATPIYIAWQEIIPEIKRYNPQLKVIVLLRDPVERALSQYAMEFVRNNEARPLWLALLLEGARLHRDKSRAPLGARRCHSYRTRGEYVEQLEHLRRHFPDKQILVIDNTELIGQHDQTLVRVYDFLGVPVVDLPASERVFSGDYDRARYPMCRWLLGCWYRFANRRLKSLLSDMGYSPNWPWLR
jgi:hypothetical protein